MGGKSNKHKVSALLNRAGMWETRSKQAALKGDHNRAGRLRTKSLQLAAEARRLGEDTQEGKEQ